MGKRNVRFVAQGVTGGWRIWNRKIKKHWGFKFPVHPELLLAELNGQRRPDEITRLTNCYRNGERP